jgi:hypothetical protein
MERILMPKMLDIFQKISLICQKIIDKSSAKNASDPKIQKEIKELKAKFEDLSSEISFNDTLIKGLDVLIKRGNAQAELKKKAYLIIKNRLK